MMLRSDLDLVRITGRSDPRGVSFFTLLFISLWLPWATWDREAC